MAHTAHKDSRMMEEVRQTPQELENAAIEVSELIRRSKHTVFFTGAGISTAAGIPDYRGPTGVWTLAAAGRDGEATGLGGRRVNMTSAVPTYTHMAMVALQRAGKLHHIISQNVDGLHRKSGIPAAAISELHGNSNAEECNRCGKRYYRDFSVHAARGNHYTGRRCTASGCNGELRDTIINFGENLPIDELETGFETSSKAELHICFGSSLTVSPACDMPRATKDRGGKLVIVNLQRTPLDAIADVRVHAQVDTFLERVMALLQIEVRPFTLVRHITLWRPEAGQLAVAGVDVADGNCPQTLFDGASLMDASTAAQLPAASFSVDTNSDPLVVQSSQLAPDAGSLGAGALHVGLSFFGHYAEPSLTLPVPAAGASCTTECHWDLASPEWQLSSSSAGVQMPDYGRGTKGPRRTDDGQASAPPPAPNAQDTTGWFAVTPLAHCDHCPAVALREGISLDVNAPCVDCGNVGENMMCLTCFEVHCGRHVNQHMLAHNQATHHPLVCGFVDLSFWCYECESYIDSSNRHLKPVYRLLSAVKFAEN